jgi:cytochrome c553
LNGTPAEIEQRKKALANLDEFSDIRSLWAGCAACHGAEGQGMAVFPKLAGQSQDYIVSRLNAYKNRETVGNMSSTMWAQAGMLSDADINMIGKFIEVELK